MPTYVERDQLAPFPLQSPLEIQLFEEGEAAMPSYPLHVSQPPSNWLLTHEERLPRYSSHSSNSCVSMIKRMMEGVGLATLLWRHMGSTPFKQSLNRANVMNVSKLVLPCREMSYRGNLHVFLSVHFNRAKEETKRGNYRSVLYSTNCAFAPY